MLLTWKGGVYIKGPRSLLGVGCRNSLHCCLFVGVYVCVFEWEFLWRHKHLRQFLNNDDRSVSWEGGNDYFRYSEIDIEFYLCHQMWSIINTLRIQFSVIHVHVCAINTSGIYIKKNSIPICLKCRVHKPIKTHNIERRSFFHIDILISSSNI